MATAKKIAKETVVAPFPERVKILEEGLLKLIQETQVGLRPELAADRTKIAAVLNYIDLVEISKLNEDKAKQVETK